MQPSTNKKHIVIVGFGETGVLSAIHLNDKYKDEYQITAISTKPSLVSGQELGARLAEPSQWMKNYYTDFERYKQLEGVELIHGQVTALLTDEKALQVKRFQSPAAELRLSYDILLIATGVTNGFWRSAQMQSDQQIQASIAQYASMFDKAETIAVIGGGPSGAGCSYHLKSANPKKAVHYFFSGEKPLPHHHPATQDKVLQQLSDIGVVLHKGHRAIQGQKHSISKTPIQWSTGQAEFHADVALWTTGQTQPNSDFLPKEMLDAQGFVNTNPYLQVTDHDSIFCVGDIANTDKNRSSARNFAFKLVANNIHNYAQGKSQKMQEYTAPDYRWGSVLGVQSDGMRVFTPKGKVFRFPHWSINSIVFPMFVRKGIYRGMKKPL